MSVTRYKGPNLTLRLTPTDRAVGTVTFDEFTADVNRGLGENDRLTDLLNLVGFQLDYWCSCPVKDTDSYAIEVLLALCYFDNAEDIASPWGISDTDNLNAFENADSQHVLHSQRLVISNPHMAQEISLVDQSTGAVTSSTLYTFTESGHAAANWDVPLRPLQSRYNPEQGVLRLYRLARYIVDPTGVPVNPLRESFDAALWFEEPTIQDHTTVKEWYHTTSTGINRGTLPR